MVEDAGRGYRRVVASPRPLRIVETPQIRTLFDAGYVVIISTGVDQVAIHYRRSDQRILDRLTVSEARAHLDSGEFLPGSMGPKIEAAIMFLERGGGEVLITSPYRLAEAVAGRTGTRIVPDSPR
ncbi:MAG TPA: hypothetical protein VEZ44_01655 [bacterium]|nr:hypothetical protein [bacterium]